jgi:hypothetical protein
MATKNEITGDTLVTKSSNKKYDDGWEKVFGVKAKIIQRMDKLQEMMESDYHFEQPEEVYEHTLTVSKFWSVLSEEDRDYIQAAQDAIETKSDISWKR